MAWRTKLGIHFLGQTPAQLPSGSLNQGAKKKSMALQRESGDETDWTVTGLFLHLSVCELSFSWKMGGLARKSNYHSSE